MGFLESHYLPIAHHSDGHEHGDQPLHAPEQPSEHDRRDRVSSTDAGWTSLPKPQDSRNDRRGPEKEPQHREKAEYAEVVTE